MLHNNGISDSQLSSVVVVDHDAASWTAEYRWLAVILWAAALTAMDEEILTSTQLLGMLWVQIERTGALGGFMHNIFTISNFIGWGRKRPDISWCTLFVRIEIPFVMPWVSHRLNARNSLTSNESAGVLVESKKLRLAIRQSSATITFALWMREICMCIGQDDN